MNLLSRQGREGNLKEKQIQVIWLDKLLIALQNAVLSAHKASLSQHLEILGRHFKKKSVDDGEDKASQFNSPCIANTVSLEILDSSNFPNKDNSESLLQVPTACLIPHNSLLIDEVTVDFECIFSECSVSDVNHKERLGLHLIRGESSHLGTPARISIRYKVGDPPEGVARIDDQLVEKIS